ncbi:MAG: glycosyltransferase family 39 protein [Actinomycetota bacterium]|nr:glycosyltransferase family 39 protein [Actinomycetota bacterium]
MTPKQAPSMPAPPAAPFERGREAHESAGGALALVAAVTAAALALYLFRLGHKSFWLDEGASFAFARIPLSDLWDLAATRQANMSLYYLLLHFWMWLGEGEAVLRTLSVLFAAGTVPLTYLIGRRLFGLRAGVIAGALIALNAFVVQYAQEARGYTLALFLATLASYLLVRAVEEPARSLWVAYGLVVGLGAYAHLFVLLVAGAHLLAVVGTRRGRRVLRPALGALGGGLLLALPMVLFPLVGDRGQIDWLGAPGVREVVTGIGELVGDGGAFLLLAYVAAVGAAFVAGSSHDRSWAFTVAGTWLFLPIVVSAVASTAKPIFLPRYLIVCVPALAVLAGAGVAALGRLAAAVVASALVAGSAFGLWTWYFDTPKEEWRPAAEHVIDNARPQDGIVVYAGRARRPFEYYVARDDAEDQVPDPLFPAGEWGSDPSAPVGQPRLAQLRNEFARLDRVWLILSHARTGPGSVRNLKLLTDALESSLDLASSFRFYRVEVNLYTAEMN